MRSYHMFALFLGMAALIACGQADLPSAGAPAAQVAATSAPVQAVATTAGLATAALEQATLPPPAADTGSAAPPPRATAADAARAPSPVVSSAVAASGPTVGQAAAQAGRPITVLPAATTGPARAPTPLRGPATITMKDNQQVLELAVGDTFTLKLGLGMIWTVEELDERILARDAGAAPNEAQGVYKAIAPGETELRAYGSPACAKAKPPCQMPDVLFLLKVVVR